MFIESLGNTTIHNGIMRIECRILGGDGKEHVAGHLVFPAQQAGRIAQQLGTILTEMKKKVEETASNKPN